ELEQALRLNPGYTTALYNLGLTEYLGTSHGRTLDAARTHLERVLDLDPEYMSAHYVLGLVDLLEYDWENAEGRFYKVQTKWPEDLHTLVHLGKCQLENRRAHEAVLTLSKRPP